MPLDKHLVVHLQEMYATERDFRDFLCDWSGQVKNAQLQSAVSEQIEGIGDELQNLQQCLSTFGAAPNEEMKSPIVQALRQEDRATMQAMPNMTAADMDVHVAMTDIGFGHMELGFYQGMIDMAQALNKQDLVNTLQQSLSAEQQDVQQMQNLLPSLISESQQRAA